MTLSTMSTTLSEMLGSLQTEIADMILDEVDALINDFAVRSFRDVADAEYIAARMACRAALVPQFLWASQQTVEKYLKCILLLNRIPARKVFHDLDKALRKIKESGRVTLDLTPGAKKFIEMLDHYGQFRYFEISNIGFGGDLITLDRAVWELRRYCTVAKESQQAKLRNGFSAPRVRIPGGYLEKIIDDIKNHAREPLLWQNAFFGNRPRKMVRLWKWFQAHNAPLYLNPQILDDVLKYVYIPPRVEAAYRAHTKQ
jgi:HEPN domain-containing protein